MVATLEEVQQCMDAIDSKANLVSKMLAATTFTDNCNNAFSERAMEPSFSAVQRNVCRVLYSDPNSQQRIVFIYLILPGDAFENREDGQRESLLGRAGGSRRVLHRRCQPGRRQPALPQPKREEVCHHTML
uniref:Pectinesterase inhibitor domain-containing protein n=1 Tax=Oryza brachyantha TaxID=4533 RepID=J3KVZ8_ORYBR